jgi:hypothetical protein
MLVVVLIAVAATIGLLAWLVAGGGWTAFETRLPSAIARIGPLPFRRLERQAPRPDTDRQRETSHDAPVYADDVERVVRERLYGSRPDVR